MDERAEGPWDLSQVDFGDGVDRLDLGGLLVAPADGIEVQVQVDESSGQIAQLTFTRADAAVQVQPYAAPRSGGLWDDVRAQIRSSINSAGGLVEDGDGPFGAELRAQVASGDGSGPLQPARFTGVEGPRWFLRAVFLGSAARPGPGAQALEEFVRSLVVVRGGEAMPVGAPIVLRLPVDAEQQSAEPALPSPFERGPEITEIR